MKNDNFKSVQCISAFYYSYYEETFYEFETIPEIDNGDWAISGGGDSAFHLPSEQVTTDFPVELLQLLPHIPDDIEVEEI